MMNTIGIRAKSTVAKAVVLAKAAVPVMAKTVVSPRIPARGRAPLRWSSATSVAV